MERTERTISFPEINWEKLGKGSLPKGEAEDKIREAVKFLVEVRALKRTNFLAKTTLDQDREVSQNLEELVEQFPQLKGVVQNLFGQLVKEMAGKDGDSKTLFGRLDLLIEEALYYGALQEWSEEKLESVPRGLTESFLVRMRSGKDQFRYFLPSNWRNETHKRTTLVLRDLAIKAKNTWMAEKGIEPKSKPKTPPAETGAKKETADTTPKKRRTKKDKETMPEETPEDEAGKQIKIRKAKDRKEADETNVRNIIKTGVSLADNPDALDLLKK